MSSHASPALHAYRSRVPKGQRQPFKEKPEGTGHGKHNDGGRLRSRCLEMRRQNLIVFWWSTNLIHLRHKKDFWGKKVPKQHHQSVERTYFVVGSCRSSDCSSLQTVANCMTLGISFNFSRSQLSWDCMGAVKNTEIIYQPVKAWYLLVLPKCPQNLPSACSWHPYPMLQDHPPGRCSKGYSLKHSRFFPGICLCFSYLQKKKVGAPSRRMAVQSRGSSSHWLECHSCSSWGRPCPADPTLAFRVGLAMQTGITVKTMTHRWSQNNVLKTSVSSGQ